MGKRYDVMVLGGGSAGTAAAAAAAGAGARTAMVNDGELGGLCILRGCMPTKTLLASANAIHHANHLEPFGVEPAGRAEPDFGRIMERKDRLVRRFQEAKIASIESGGYDVIDGRARFAEGGGVRIGDRDYEARAYVIATGSTPAAVPIPGIDDVRVWTSDDVMRLERAPRRLLVQGAGAIGLELGQFFARIGTEVTLVNRSPLLAHYDPIAGEELCRAFESEPRFELMAPAAIQRLRPKGDGLIAEIMATERTLEVEADALLVAVGRKPLLDSLGLEHVDLEVVGNRLPHDTTLRTFNPRVWVAGDVTGNHQILHLSTLEGRTAGLNAAGADPPNHVDYRLMMQTIFVDPPYSSVGLTCEEALRRGDDEVVVGRVALATTGRAITMEVSRGVWSLLAERSSGEILGASMLGPRSDDLIHQVAVMMRYRTKVAEILAMPWYHPTLSEVMLDLARDVLAKTG